MSEGHKEASREDKKCKMEGCKRPYRAKAYCNVHYRQWRHGALPKGRYKICTKEGCPRPAFVDYKDVPGLKKLCTSQGKLFSRKRSGNCAAFQRAVKDAIKRARFMALLPYVGE